MPNSGKSVLLFLGTCLAFAEAGLVTIARLAGASGTVVAAFTLAALGMVLLTLLLMYKWNPGFLTIEGGQASRLTIGFLQNLEWQNHVKEFDRNTLKVLVVLSDRQFKWRSADNIAAITGLDVKDVVQMLDDLIGQGWVHASISVQGKTIVFGLTERIGPEKFGIKTPGKFPARIKLGKAIWK